MSSASAGVFFTTEPSRKPHSYSLLIYNAILWNIFLSWARFLKTRILVCSLSLIIVTNYCELGTFKWHTPLPLQYGGWQSGISFIGPHSLQSLWGRMASLPFLISYRFQSLCSAARGPFRAVLHAWSICPLLIKYASTFLLEGHTQLYSGPIFQYDLPIARPLTWSRLQRLFYYIK